MSYNFVFPNNLQTTLSAAVAPGDTVINITDATNVPTLAAGEAFPITDLAS